MLYRNWQLPDKNPAAVAALSTQTGLSRLAASVMVARGLNEPDKVRAMLGECEMPDPFTLTDMDKAVERIQAAFDNQELIVVFGDYDVDGITSTALLYSYFESQGAEVFYKLPSRSDEGYGLTPQVVEQVAASGITLIVTVDNGTSAIEAVERANQLGVDVVVTDHHLPPEKLPPVVALVNPCREEEGGPYANLSGVGVALLLASAVEGCSPQELLEVFGEFVAIGTVADVMKLTGINRAFVRAGLDALAETQRPGLHALLQSCGLDGKEITAENISYALAPRLNAAGRMDDAADALRLLLAEDEEEALEAVALLEQQNTDRRETEQQIVEEIIAEIQMEPELLAGRVLVVWGDGWHQGIIGIVASRLVERYGRPTIIISFDESGEGRGSGRSFGGFPLYDAIAANSGLLTRFGGHAMAAGLSIEKGKEEAFRQGVNEWAAQNHPLFTMPPIMVDACPALSDLTVEEVEGLSRLAPFGSGNPAPVFMLQNAVVEAVYPLSEGKHCRLRLRQGTEVVYAVLFGEGPAQLQYGAGSKVDALLSLSMYEGKTGKQVSARVKELRPAGIGQQYVEQAALFEGFAAGVDLSWEQKAALCPTREEVGEVYRLVKSKTPPGTADARPAFARLPEIEPGRVLSALAILEQLELVTRNAGEERFEATEKPQKRNLQESTIMQNLERTEGAVNV
ncbi:MAG: single-stranded-DNA-specific exonuclease RecJ [Oscillospiraceae bacterium]